MWRLCIDGCVGEQQWAAVCQAWRASCLPRALSNSGAEPTHSSHQTHVLGWRASLGPHGITALPPTQATTHMWYQMYGRGFKTPTIEYLRTPPNAQHEEPRIHVTYMTDWGASKNVGWLILRKPSAPGAHIIRAQTLLKASKDQQTSWGVWK